MAGKFIGGKVQFKVCIDINGYPLDKFEIENVILVQDRNDDNPGRKRERKFFEEVKWIGKITNKNAWEAGTSVYLLRGAKVSINNILHEEIKSR